MVAAYVSIGREFMPAVSGYTSFFEGQIYESTGLPVQIDSISGSFDGFNPVLQLNNLPHFLIEFFFSEKIHLQ